MECKRKSIEFAGTVFRRRVTAAIGWGRWFVRYDPDLGIEQTSNEKVLHLNKYTDCTA